jgi:hypothetical protein
MISPSRFAGAVAALATAASLGAAGVADASAGQNSYQKTYPRASSLCAAVGLGAGPKRLRPAAVKAEVLADCTVLLSGFTAAQAAVLTGDASIGITASAERSSVSLLCGRVKPHPAACTRARHKEARILTTLHRQRVHLAHVYYNTIEANRRIFWAAIGHLPGGANLPADAPIPTLSS